ncbi:MazG-like family protein [Paenibacillus algorifonticola]|uniref:MazG nucleotide pyrophosphohydrolase domain-containing protein n=1 Tax=Paenibacillus algorifonticola TaxID=684063 RepID=UPI003D26B0EE
MQLSEMQKHVKEFSTAHGFDESTIEQRALYLVTEVGETVKELLHLSYHPDHEKKEEIKDRLGLEMYDIVWNICDLANKLDIDLEQAFSKKIEINKTRTW